jgi:hypothetical protein
LHDLTLTQLSTGFTGTFQCEAHFLNAWAEVRLSDLTMRTAPRAWLVVCVLAARLTPTRTQAESTPAQSSSSSDESEDWLSGMSTGDSDQDMQRMAQEDAGPAPTKAGSVGAKARDPRKKKKKTSWSQMLMGTNPDGTQKPCAATAITPLPRISHAFLMRLLVSRASHARIRPRCSPQNEASEALARGGSDGSLLHRSWRLDAELQYMSF